ncbi:hypothetical protein K488DRAFT_48201 [Vararia minispora EC-137]|uniref:Uncharacterized protein n=1 Tax=Vararia minispora EC-137 TaxID=1314806 RepID=A0ACB8QMW6_9AGAM|nr:hypothetical protein K488DRAFT_48201 [Vararia minispora EC-137]
MATSTSKPLPDVPRSPSEELTIDGREHLRRFLDSALAQESEVLKSWAFSLETALSEVVDAMRDDDWLSGIRLARMLRKKKIHARDPNPDPNRGGQKEKPRKGLDDEKARGATSAAEGEALKDWQEGREGTEDNGSDGSHPPRKASPAAPNPAHRHNVVALQQLRDLASARKPASGASAKHLLFTIMLPADVQVSSLHSSTSSAASRTCTFHSREFALPKPDLFGEDPTGNADLANKVSLYGFKEWETDPELRPNPVSLVGGSFSFSPPPSAEEREALVKVLRISIFVLLSLLLEQSFLADENAELRFPEPKPRVRPFNRMLSPTGSSTTFPGSHSPDVRHRFRDSFLSTSIFGIFSKKTSGLLNRFPSLSPSPTSNRGGSLDLVHSLVSSPPASVDDTPPTRLRRFSLFGEHRRSAGTQSSSVDEPLFQFVLRRLQEAKDVLSTSPDVEFPPPFLLASLAEKEKADPSWRLSGEERTALNSVFGWNGRRTRGAGMAGTHGFLRQQRISVLYSEHITLQSNPTSSHASGIAPAPDRDTKIRLHCGPRARLRTFEFYTTDRERDYLLGDIIIQVCLAADEKCHVPKCLVKRGQHELRWLHKSCRIIAKVRKLDDAEAKDECIQAWESCIECGKISTRSRISNGTYLLSFGKFLELLFYSSRLCIPSRPLCSHTTPPPQPWTGDDAPLPRSRFNIVRHFAFKSHVLSFTLSPIYDIFELRLPHLQLTSTPGRVSSDGGTVHSSTTRQEMEGSEEKKLQRKEIKAWWQCVAEHLDKLEAYFDDDPSSSYRKTLPRIPSTWEDRSATSSSTVTPRAGTASLPSSPSSPSLAPPSQLELERVVTPDLSLRSQGVPIDIYDPLAEAQSPRDHSAEALALLTNMRFTFQRIEQELYFQLRDVPEGALNDVRRVFHSAGLGSLRRLAAWEAKHLSKTAREEVAENRKTIENPWWWRETYHAVPGSNIIVKDDDWGSIIAFTLSSVDYQDELGNLTCHRRALGATPVSSSLPTHPPLPPLNSGGGGLFSPALSTASESSFKFFNKPSPLSLDPDNDGAVWAEPEAWSAVITRKEHPRDPTALLSLREVLRQRAPVDASIGLPPSIMTGVSRIIGGGEGSGDRSLVYAKQAVEVSKQLVDGQHTLDVADTVEKLLHELDSASVTSSSTSANTPSEPSSTFVTTNIERRKTSSVISRGSAASSKPDSTSSDETATPVDATMPRESDAGTVSSSASSPGGGSMDQQERAEHDSTFSWTSSLTNAIRLMAKGGDPRTRVGTPQVRNGHHDLLGAQAGNIDERPHIKYDWTIGKRLRYSCTVYYAKQFDLLRKQCGIEDVFLKSMSRSANWSADGGKSKSNFWKTADDRFIIKTLVNAWNVADLQVLIELAPSYFRHMEATVHRASVLAKLLGFYTVEIRNLEAGTVQAKADLLVMENLFYSQSVSKTFDLKGIQGRKVKTTNASASKTLFDGEWIEGQEKALTLVYPHSKAVLHEGLKFDCEFLAKSNIMDYSLLLGVNEADKQISCGLVDTIGSYTFAKTLEYKAKQGFSGKDGKEVTVMPPHEYQERFIKTLDGYFLACPVSDKWTKPEDEKTTYEYTDLPSVL